MEPILRILKKNPVEKHDAFLLRGNVISQESSIDSYNLGDVKVLRRIGLGTHAEVYEVMPIRPDLCHIRVALKIEKPIKHAGGFIDQEIALLGSIGAHDCVPKLLGVYTREIGGVCCRGFCMELFHDSLSSLKTQKGFTEPTDPAQKSRFLEYLSCRMFDAILQFHKHEYLHRDIKPSNFMFRITPQNTLCIALIDFGSSISIGARNPSEFRGTGAYASISSDPWLSKEEDDYWSTIFSILDLCIPGGLPWRSLSARSEEGRSEINAQKQAFFQSIVDDVSTDLTSHVPEKIKKILKLVLNQQTTSFTEVIRDFITLENHDWTSQVIGFIHEFLSPSLVRISLPKSLGQKTSPAAILLDGASRPLVETECELPSASSAVLFPISPTSEILLIEQAILHQAASNKYIGKTPDMVALGERICISELSLGHCQPPCPLRHLACTGIVRSAIVRSTCGGKICFDNFFDKCHDKNCNKLHLDSEMVRRMYIDYVVPSYQPNKRSKHS